MNILSVQSWVSYGHVGNAAALFPLQRLGAEVWTINTVQFSNHPGYGSHAGRLTGGPAVAELVGGLAALCLLPEIDAILSGYLGDEASLLAVLGAVAQTRALRPGMLFCCDPVLGDQSPGVYVAEPLARALRDQAVHYADILTPNLFELGFLLGRSAAAPPPDTLAAVARDARRLLGRMRPHGTVLVSSVETADMPPDQIGLLLCNAAGCHVLQTPRLPIATNGAGDLLAALFLWGMLTWRDPVAALDHAASAVWCVLEHTVRHGAREPMIVQAQAELVAPTRRFGSVLLQD